MAKQGNSHSRGSRAGGNAAAPVKSSSPKDLAGGELAKVTLYVRPDQIVAIETIQLDERKRTGSRPDKSRLVQEALDLLIREYSRK